MLGTVFSGPDEFALAFVVFALAYGVYSLFGFGASLIVMGALAVVMPVQDVAVIVLLVNFPLEVFILRQARGELAWRPVIIIAAGVILCVPLGGYLLAVIAPETALRVLGGVLIASAIFFLVLRRDSLFPRQAWLEPFVGCIAGLLGGMLGTSGPPLVLYFQAVGMDKTRFRYALLAIFHTITWLRLATYFATDLLTVPRALSSLSLLPAMALGAFVGRRMHVGITEATFRRLVSAALFLIGVSLLIGRS